MITATQEIADQLEEIRQSGMCNMLNFDCVQMEADQNGFFNLVVWMEDVGRRGYGAAIIRGITVED